MSEYKERIVSSPYVAQVNNSENKQLYITKLVAHINIPNANAARTIDSIVLCFSGKNMLEHNLEDYEDEHMEYNINSDKSITVTRLDAPMGSASTASAYKYFYTNSNDVYDGTIIHTPIYGSADTLYFSDGSTQSNLNNITYRYTMGGSATVTYVPSSDNVPEKLIEDVSTNSTPMRTISQCRFIFTDDTVSNMQVPFTMKPMIEYGSASGIYEAYDGAKYQVIVGAIFTAEKDYTYDILEGKIYDENKTVILDNIQIPNINRYFKNGINNVWFYFANSEPTTTSKKMAKAISVTTSKKVSGSKPFYESSISLELHYLEPVQSAEQYLIQGTTLTSIANAIRTKEASSDPIDVDDFATKIANLPSGSTLITKSITENGTYDAEDDDADGYSSVTVDVAGSGPARIIDLIPTKPLDDTNVITSTLVSGSAGYYGLTDDSNNWSSSATPAYLGYHFDMPVKCNRYKIVLDNGSNTQDEAPITWLIEGSNDGTNWVVIDRCGCAWSDVTEQTFIRNFYNDTYYAYLRLNCQSRTGTNLTIQYLEFDYITSEVEPEGVVDLIPSVVAQSAFSSGITGRWYAENAFDNSNTSAWLSNSLTFPLPSGTECYVGYKTGSAVCNRIYLKGHRDVALDDTPVDYYIEGSNDDGATWTQLVHVQKRMTSANDSYFIDFENSTAYTSYRMNILEVMAGSGNRQACVAIFHMYNVIRSDQGGES